MSSHYLMLFHGLNTGSNNLTGNIPTELGKLTGLTYLYLSKFIALINLLSSIMLLIMLCSLTIQCFSIFSKKIR